MYIVYSCEMTRSYGNEQKSAFCFSLSRLSRLIPMLHALSHLQSQIRNPQSAIVSAPCPMTAQRSDLMTAKPDNAKLLAS